MEEKGVFLTHIEQCFCMQKKKNKLIDVRENSQSFAEKSHTKNSDHTIDPWPTYVKKASKAPWVSRYRFLKAHLRSLNKVGVLCRYVVGVAKPKLRFYIHNLLIFYRDLGACVYPS
jgi:hypothetical protein